MQQQQLLLLLMSECYSNVTHQDLGVHSCSHVPDLPRFGRRVTARLGQPGSGRARLAAAAVLVKCNECDGFTHVCIQEKGIMLIRALNQN
jgi:hypothetical protein